MVIGYLSLVSDTDISLGIQRRTERLQIRCCRRALPIGRADGEFDRKFASGGIDTD